MKNPPNHCLMTKKSWAYATATLHSYNSIHNEIHLEMLHNHNLAQTASSDIWKLDIIYFWRPVPAQLCQVTSGFVDLGAKPDQDQPRDTHEWYNTVMRHLKRRFIIIVLNKDLPKQLSEILKLGVGFTYSSSIISKIDKQNAVWNLITFGLIHNVNIIGSENIVVELYPKNRFSYFFSVAQICMEAWRILFNKVIKR